MNGQFAGYFSDAAKRLAGLSARALGWLPANFWEATPADLALALQDPNESASESLSRDELNQMLEGERNG
jgi:hypothetical protein